MGGQKNGPLNLGKDSFYMMLPSWILDDGEQLDLPQLDGILIDARDVQWVEFISEKRRSMMSNKKAC